MFWSEMSKFCYAGEREKHRGALCGIEPESSKGCKLLHYYDMATDWFYLYIYLYILFMRVV